jgi:hypothetical protein
MTHRSTIGRLLPAFFILLSLGGLARAGVWEPAGPNLVPNGRFEQGLAKWFVSGDRASVAIDEQAEHDGQRALRIAAPGRPAEIRVIGFAKIDPAKKYRVTFTAKTSGVGRDPRLSAEFHGEMAAAVGLAAYRDGVWLEWCPRPDAVALTGTADWKTYAFDVLRLPPTTNSVQLHLILHQGARGTVWFDKVELRELTLRRPSLTLATSALANVFTTAEPARVEARIRNDGTPRDLTLRWDLRATTEDAAVTGSRTLHLQGGEERVEEIRVDPRVGHYELTAELRDQAERDRDRLELAVVPEPSPTPCASLGLWCGDPVLVRKAGASWTRQMAYWRYLEPEPGQYRWALLDASLARAKAAGLTVLLCFTQTARWASAAPQGHADFGSYPPKDWAHLARYVEAAARHFGPQVDAWEIWNEPVIPWGWKGTSADVVTLHRVIHDAVLRAQPKATIIGPCICQGSYPLLKLKAFQAVLPLGILDHCQGLAIHPYREPFGPEYTFFAEELTQLQAFAHERGLRQGLWITEIGWSASDYPFWPKRKVSELDQAAYLARSAVTAVAQGVRLFNWHAVAEWDIPNPHEKHFGIVHAGMTGPKPAYVACAVAAHWLAGARSKGRLREMGPLCPADRLSRDKLWDGLRPASVHAVDGYWFERAGQPLLVAWSISGREESIQFPATAEVQVQHALGRQSRLSPRNGTVELRCTELPVYVTGLQMPGTQTHPK